MIIISVIKLDAQILSGSFIIEGACLFERINQSIGDWPNMTEDKDHKQEFGMDLILSGKIKIDSLYQLEIRSGFNIASEFYRSIQLGLQLRRYLCEDYYGAVGINYHINLFEKAGHHFQPVLSTYTMNVTLIRRINKYLLVPISISKTIDSYFGVENFLQPQISSVKYYLDWVIKVGIELEF